MFSNNILPEICSKFYCENCDYKTSKKSSHADHLLSRKHLTAMNVNKILPKICSDHNCENCDKKYKDYSGLWRHKKKCIKQQVIINVEESISEIDMNNVKILTNMVLEVVKQNQELITQNSEVQKQNQELQKHVIELCKNGTNNNTNISNTNSHNKAFNLNFFLNETCKNAMNITEFADSIKLQLSDFENVGDVGFITGISNIIIKNLKALDITQRPLHCTDQKRETIYIKDEDKWEKEDDKKQKCHKFIKKIINKNQRLLLKFQEVYPDYNKYSSPNSTRYDLIVIEALGGRGDNTAEKEDKILSNISKTICVNKDTL